MDNIRLQIFDPKLLRTVEAVAAKSQTAEIKVEKREHLAKEVVEAVEIVGLSDESIKTDNWTQNKPQIRETCVAIHNWNTNKSSFNECLQKKEAEGTKVIADQLDRTREVLKDRLHDLFQFTKKEEIRKLDD